MHVHGSFYNYDFLICNPHAPNIFFPDVFKSLFLVTVIRQRLVRIRPRPTSARVTPLAERVCLSTHQKKSFRQFG